MPSVGSGVKQSKALCTLESVKAVGEVYAPLDGEVVEVNNQLEAQPSVVNDSPEEEGWLIKLKFTGQFDELGQKYGWKDAEAYKASLDQH
jgi:glycine cleavage system H protein